MIDGDDDDDDRRKKMCACKRAVWLLYKKKGQVKVRKVHVVPTGLTVNCTMS
jgi:hypothetical protein